MPAVENLYKNRFMVLYHKQLPDNLNRFKKRKKKTKKKKTKKNFTQRGRANLCHSQLTYKPDKSLRLNLPNLSTPRPSLPNLTIPRLN